MSIATLLALSFSTPVQQQFGPWEELTVGLRQARAVTAEDFDGDGDQDILAASGATGELRIWLRGPTGEYDRGTALPLSTTGIEGARAADLDQDGNIDIVAFTGESNVVWLENLGAGNFAPASTLIDLTSSGPAASAQLRVEDVNGNGWLDVLVSIDPVDTSELSKIVVALNGGGMGFQTETLVETSSQINGCDTLDVDGDGDMDLAVALPAAVAWYENNGNLGFSGPLDQLALATSVHQQQSRVEAVDFDGDGLEDIVGMSYLATVLVANDASGTLLPPRTLTSSGNLVGGISLEDVTGDGIRDVLFASTSISGGGTTFRLWPGTGPGQLGAREDFSSNASSIRSMSVQDVDGDGQVEVITGAESGAVVIRRRDTSLPHFNFETAVVELTETAARGGEIVSLGDIDGDSAPDVMVYSPTEREIAWWSGKGERQQQTIRRFEVGSHSLGHVFVRDIDLDGDLDVLYLAFPSPDVVWHENLGGGVFADFRPIVVPSTPYGLKGVADIDGDGREDLVGGDNFPVTLEWHRNLGGGTFGAAQVLDPPPGDFPAWDVADVTNDGVPDICLLVKAFGAHGATVVIYEGLGGGAFGGVATLFTVSAPFEFGWRSFLEIEDLDGDGDGDLLVAGNAMGALSRSVIQVFENQAGSFGPPTWSFNPSKTTAGVELGDVDSDGVLDLTANIPLLALPPSGLIWFKGRGDGTFDTHQSIHPTHTIHGRYGLADFDLDGDLDVILRDTNTNSTLGVIEALFVGDIGSTFCAEAVPNSTGAKGRLRATGRAAVATASLTLRAEQVPPGAFGMFLAAPSRALVYPMNTVGPLCLGGHIGRFQRPGQIQQATPSGRFTLPVDTTMIPRPNGFTAVVAGDTWHFQAWHRDVVGGAPVSNLTEAISVTFL